MKGEPIEKRCEACSENPEEKANSSIWHDQDYLLEKTPEVFAFILSRFTSVDSISRKNS